MEPTVIIDTKNECLTVIDLNLYSLVDPNLEENIKESYFYFPVLIFYSIKQKKELVWQIFYNKKTKQIYYYRGQNNGKLMGPDLITHTSKNRGETFFDKALGVMKSKYNSKIKEKYHRITEIQEISIEGMKGYNYDEKTKNKINFPAYIQPKLDGVRMLASLDSEGNISLDSYSSKSKYTQITPITEQLKSFFKFLDVDDIIDGELYTKNLSFDIISGLARTIKGALPETIDLLEFHMFDIIKFDKSCGAKSYDVPYDERFERLRKLRHEWLKSNKLKKCKLVLVPTYIVENHDEIEEYTDNFINEGYEGSMIKNISNGASKGSKRFNSSIYEFGRSYNILKYKKFFDAEVTIIGFKEGKGIQEGMMIPLVKDSNGNEFYITLEVPHEQRRLWFDHPDMVIGKQATIEYQEITATGKPRFGKLKTIRDYE